VLAAVGLLSEAHPGTAYRLAQRLAVA
jgi:hypothetical protein